MTKVMNPPTKANVCYSEAKVPAATTSIETAPAEQLPPVDKKLASFKKKRDNPHSDRFIEVGTKALRRETDVWGDAAGTAPAVTSVTSLSPSIILGTINKARHPGAPSFLQRDTGRNQRQRIVEQDA